MGGFCDRRRERHALGVGLGTGVVAGVTTGTAWAGLGLFAMVVVMLAALGLGAYPEVGDQRLGEQLRQEAHYVFGGIGAGGLVTIGLRVAVLLHT